jgi:2-methylcitrate dehydratase PrpD
MIGSFTADLAKFIHSVSYASLHSDAIEHLKLCIMDTIGCGVFGSTLGWTKILTDYFNDADASRDSCVWGTRDRFSMLNAALINGTLVHSFELDDLHARGIIHPGSVTVPTALALAEQRGKISGKKIIEAVAAGYEVGARVGMFVGTSHLLKGFHPTGTCGTFASAATAGKLLGLSKPELIHALGIAGAQSAGLMAAQYASMVKRMHAGRAAQSGLFAASLARRGFTGATDILEASYGGFGSSMSDQVDDEAAVSGLGNTNELLNVGFKPYACCGSNHTTIDALKQIFSESKLSAEEIEKIEIKTSKATKLHVGWPYSPDTVTTAQMNLYYCAAAFIFDGDVFIDQFTEDRIRDPQIMEFIPKIVIEEDRRIDAEGPLKRHSVNVKIFTRTDRTYERKIDYPWGNPKNPMTKADIEAKFRKLTGKAMANKKIDQLIEKILNLDDLLDSGHLLN